MFSKEDLLYLSARASTIDERIAGGYEAEDTPASARKAIRRLKAWCKSATNGDEAMFSEYLVHNGLDIDTVTRFLGDVCLTYDQQTPKWIETFRWITEAIQASVISDETTQFIYSERPVPFEELFVPLVIAARKQRDHQTKTRSTSTSISEMAHADLQRSLLHRLSQLCAPTLLEGFFVFQMSEQPMMMALALKRTGNTKSRSHYEAYIAELREGGLREYFLNRPVVARLVVTVTEQWMAGTAELISRLSDDLTAIYKTFYSGLEPKSVTRINYGLSDPHNNGRVVCALTFSDGLKVVYKPKDLGLDVAWSKLLHCLHAAGAPPCGKAPIVIQRQTYGWAEWIEPAPCNNENCIPEFYHKAGSMLCLMYVLQGSDFHFENVIASGNQPVVIDVETLMHPWIANPFPIHGHKSAFAAAVEHLRNSVLATGYLPNWVAIPGGRVTNIGGLSSVDFCDFKHWDFLDVNTDGMSITQVMKTIEAKSHLPKVNGKQVPRMDSSKDIIAGFEAMYRFLMTNRSGALDALDLFVAQTVRVVLRPTQLYTLLLSRSQESQNLCDGADWSLHFDFLCRFSGWNEEERLQKIVKKAERESLARLDVPFFSTHTDTDELMLPNGQYVQRFFERSSFEQTAERLQKLDETNMKTQAAIIRQSFKNAASYAEPEQNKSWPRKTKHPCIITPKIAVVQARACAATLERSAVRACGCAAWVGVVPLFGGMQFQLDVIGYDLYSGACGVALFLAALERVSGDDYRDLTFEAFAPLREDLQGRRTNTRLVEKMRIGGGEGLGSAIYALVRSADLLNEPALIEDAQQIATMISDERIAADVFLDVMAGAAGAIFGLLALYRTCKDNWVLQRAIACGNHLLTNQMKTPTGARAWKTIGNSYLTGMSHGAAGIAFALLRLYEASGNQEFYYAALDGIRYERSVYSVEAENWPDLREGPGTIGPPAYPCQWSHGASGVGLARLGGLDVLDDDEIRQEINAAVQTTVRFPMTPLDDLSCGNFGRLELLHLAGSLLGRSELTELAERRALLLLERAKDGHCFRWSSGTNAQNPGLFTGIAGIGYELLRLTHPRVLPSVLLWM